MEINELSNQERFWADCEIASVLCNEIGLNSHAWFYIRTAIREASKRVTTQKGSRRNVATIISKDVHSVIQNKQEHNFILEHVVPVSYLTELVIKLPKITKESIAEVLLKWATLSVITIEEDKKLSLFKLSRNIPADWDGKDKFARYKKAGIEIVHINFKDAIKNS